MMLLMTILSGCWDENQPERMLYINAIGVDYKDGQYEVYAQIINFANMPNLGSASRTMHRRPKLAMPKGTRWMMQSMSCITPVDQKVYFGGIFITWLCLEAVMKNMEMLIQLSIFLPVLGNYGIEFGCMLQKIP